MKPEGLETARLANESKANVRMREEPRLFAENKVNVKEESVHSSFWSKSQKLKREKVEEQRVSAGLVEDGDFPEDPDWFLVGRTLVTALSTPKGRKLVDNEIVNFSFPSPNSRYNTQWIVRFSTKRSREVYPIYIFILLSGLLFCFGLCLLELQSYVFQFFILFFILNF